MSAPASRWSRPLGLGETFFWQMDRVVPTNFVAYAELGGALSKQAVTQAVAALQLAHPLLRAQIIPGELLPRFESVDTQAEVLELSASAEAVEAHWLRELDRPFPEDSGPLFRCHFASGAGQSWVGLTLHHAIGDGRAGIELVTELLRVVGLGQRPEPQPIPVPVESHYRPAHFEATDKLSHLGAVLMDLKRRAKGASLDRPLPGLCEKLPPRRALRHRCWELSLAQTQALATRARSERTSVHGLLGALYLTALHQELFPTKEPVVLALNSPVDLRTRGAPLAGTPAMYIAAATSYLEVGTGDLGQLARALREDLRGQLDVGAAHLMYELAYGKTPPRPEHQAAVALQERLLRSPWGSMLTNVGVHPRPSVGPGLEVKQLAFVMSPLPYQAVTLSVSTCERLKLHAVYDALNLPPERAEALLERFGRGLGGG